MFGFAIWDDRRQRLLVARDRLGIKPLYYWPTGDGVAFASELRALVTLPGFPRALDHDALADYMALGYVAEPRSDHRRRVASSRRHIASSGRATSGVRVERYWSPTVAENGRITEARGDRRDASPARRVGAHCTCCPMFHSARSSRAASIRPASSRPCRGCPTSRCARSRSGSRSAEFDESPHAASVARAFGTRHTQLVVRPDADLLFDQVARALDEPFADPSALPTFLVSHLARRDVTVALSGDGGDELFGGYTRYFEMHGAFAVARGWRGPCCVGSRLRLPHVTYGRNLLLDLGRTMRGRYAATVAFPVSEAEGGLLRDHLAARALPFDEDAGPMVRRVRRCATS